MTDKVMPIMHCPTIKSIPWAMIEPHEKQARANHGQSLARLAERGGLSTSEAIAIMLGLGWARVKHCEENDRYLAQQVEMWKAKNGPAVPLP